MKLFKHNWETIAMLACSLFILAACGHGILWRLW